MAYVLDVSDEVDEIFEKLGKKNKKQIEIIQKKMRQILENPYHFKPLGNVMHGERRVHIDKSFVLTYKIIEEIKTVLIVDYDHHDKIYR